MSKTINFWSAYYWRTTKSRKYLVSVLCVSWRLYIALWNNGNKLNVFWQTLDLSNNKLTSIDGLEDLPLRELRLSGNNLTTLKGLDRLSHLSTLLVSDNQITSLSPLQGCGSLVLVDASHNQLRDVRQSEFLTGVQWLRVLQLCGNPCCRKELYRFVM
jgi:Leucine-rich repeat (LRR) protein